VALLLKPQTSPTQQSITSLKTQILGGTAAEASDLTNTRDSLNYLLLAVPCIVAVLDSHGSAA